MTDPVVPAQPGGQYPPNAGGPAFPPPNAGAPGFPPPNAGAPGFPPPNAGAPGFPPPGQGEIPAPVQPEAPKKKGWMKRALGIVVTVVVVVAIKSFLGGALAGDPTGDAKAGDCIAIKNAMTETASQVEAEVTECSAGDAKYTVLGRVDGVKDVNSTACDATFDTQLKEGEEGYVISSDESGGYLLCLKAK
jgi:hypothetical protein